MAKMNIEELRALSLQIDDLYAAANADEGRKLLEQTMAHAKESDAAYDLFFQGEWAGYEEKDFEKQRELFAKALELAPKDFFLLRNMGMSLSNLGKEEEAITWFEKALTENPKDWDAMRNRGVSLSELGKEEEAITWFDKALAGNPKDWDAMRQRGVSLSELGKEEEAIPWYDKALAENPKDWDAMRQRGVSLSELGKAEEAITWYDKALLGNPKDWSAMRNRGVSLSKLGKEEEAIPWYDKALAENPKDWHAMRQRGVSLSELGKEEEAITWFDKALAENPKDWNAMRQRGVSLSLLGKMEEAITWYDKALAENPKDWDAMRQRGVSLSKLGRMEEAITWYDKALAENPKDWDAMRDRGSCLFKLEQFEESLDWLGKSLDINNQDEATHYWLAKAYYEIGENEKAWHSIERACELAPSDKYNKQTRAFLAKQLGKTKVTASKAGKRKKQEAPEQHQELVALIRRVRDAVDEPNELLNEMDRNLERYKDFLSGQPAFAPDQSLFMVLRKWNSYTPAIPTFSDDDNVGGGYYVLSNGVGTVIDPGYDFIKNFANAGGRFSDIHNIVITHAHWSCPR